MYDTTYKVVFLEEYHKDNIEGIFMRDGLVGSFTHKQQRNYNIHRAHTHTRIRQTRLSYQPCHAYHTVSTPPIPRENMKKWIRKKNENINGGTGTDWLTGSIHQHPQIIQSFKSTHKKEAAVCTLHSLTSLTLTHSLNSLSQRYLYRYRVFLYPLYVIRPPSFPPSPYTHLLYTPQKLDR